MVSEMQRGLRGFAGTILWVFCASSLAVLFLHHSGAQVNPPSAAVDTDGDGIPDSVETGGFDVTYADGSAQHIDLAANGDPRTTRTYLFLLPG
jgi:hypothetical protein